MVDDVDLAQDLLRHIYLQSIGQLQAVHHHVREFLADQGHALRIIAAQKALDVRGVEPLEVFQKFRHLHGHGHGHVLRILHAVFVAPTLAAAHGQYLPFQLANGRIAVVRQDLHPHNTCLCLELYHIRRAYANPQS